MEPVGAYQQKGVAILMVLVVIMFLSVMLPASITQMTLGFDQVASEIEKQRAETLLDSMVAYANMNDVCDPLLQFNVYSNTKNVKGTENILYSADVICVDSKVGKVVKNGIISGETIRSLSKQYPARVVE